MFDTETVTTRPPACGVADIFPAESISAMIQPPKMSPLGLQSAGIARVREASSPFGSVEFRPLSLERIPPSPGCGYRSSMLQCNMKLSMSLQILKLSLLQCAKFNHCRKSAAALTILPRWFALRPLDAALRSLFFNPAALISNVTRRRSRCASDKDREANGS